MTAAVFSLSGWLLYPFTLGLVAAVNPCGFPLLPVYLSLFVEGSDEHQDLPRRLSRALVAGSFATCGFIAIFGLLGILSEEGLRNVYGATASWARWIMIALGTTLVVAGLSALFGRQMRLKLPTFGPGIGLRRPLAAGVFGMSYAIASIGCSLPLFLGGIAGSFTRTGVTRGIEIFLAYALGMGLVLEVAAVAIAVAGKGSLRRLRSMSRFVGRLGGLALTLVGAYLLLYWITAVVSPTGSSPPVNLVERIQADIAVFLQEEASLVGAALGALCLASVAVATLRRRGRRRPSASPIPNRPPEVEFSDEVLVEG